MVIKPENFTGIEVLDHDEVSRPLYPDELKAMAEAANKAIGETKRLYSIDGSFWGSSPIVSDGFTGYIVGVVKVKGDLPKKS